LLFHFVGKGFFHAQNRINDKPSVEDRMRWHLSPQGTRGRIISLANGEEIWASLPVQSMGLGEGPYRLCLNRSRDSCHLRALQGMGIKQA
jgi:hypothetical protein